MKMLGGIGAIACAALLGCGSTTDVGNPDGNGNGNHDLASATGDGPAASTDMAGNTSTDMAQTAGGHAVKTVFLIMMENHNWSSITGAGASADYILNTLLPMASHTTMYFNAPGIHPSEPNYLWLEAGTNFSILDDLAPATNHQPTGTPHLAAQLDAAGISWRSYQEDMTAGTCPLSGVKKYAPKHNPFVFFDDETGSLNASDPGCIAHNKPMTQLDTDLAANTVARYNFITPNLCNDMHDSCAPTSDPIKQGDDWLRSYVAKIMASAAYQNGGAIFITWDESEGGDFPIGMIVVSSAAKGGNYPGTTMYTHSSTLRTMQEIFGVSPFLGDAANATDLSDLFTTFP